jgi:hypothetical protein
MTPARWTLSVLLAVSGLFAGTPAPANDTATEDTQQLQDNSQTVGHWRRGFPRFHHRRHHWRRWRAWNRFGPRRTFDTVTPDNQRQQVSLPVTPADDGTGQIQIDD